ncbi:MAG: MaoC family dehydratase N-terminal domain-containing protein, partial [Pseudomonadota bacterium]
LGPDGHPAVGGFMPQVSQPRRMWAGGRLSFQAPLVVGHPARKVSTIANVAEKTGRAGEMTFVTVRHEIYSGERLAVTEEQDIVYRHDPDPDAPKPSPKPAPTDETLSAEWSCDSTVLFRYSALTYNGHKIHYDLDHARRVEGYPGLVVHGPLLATLLLELPKTPIRRFSFRATAPIFAGETFTTCAKPTEEGLHLWVRGPDGRLAIEAEAS